MRNIYLENHTQNVVEKLLPDPFLKKTKLSISLDQQSYSLFLLYARIEDYQNTEADSGGGAGGAPPTLPPFFCNHLFFFCNHFEELQTV